MKQAFKATLLAIAVAYSGASAAVELSTDQQKFSYAMGVNMGNLLKSQGIEDIDAQALAAALDDVLAGRNLQLDLETMKLAIQNQQQKMIEKLQQAADQKRQQGQAFLEKNKSAKGVNVLDSGLQYMILNTGNGKQPQATDSVTVHYHGTLVDGTVFDSSVERGEPATFALDRVIPGFREAIVRMKVGDKWRVFVPSDLGYGEQGAGGKIGPNETLIFDIELLGIE